MEERKILTEVFKEFDTRIGGNTANPQAENGHTDIANEILEALWKINLSSYETRVLIFLLRKTYGWHKKVDAISLSQFEKEIGLDRRLIHRTLKELSSKGMIVVIPQDDRKPVCYGFQKDYQRWKLSSPKMTHRKAIIPRDDRTIIPQDDGLSSQGIPTKETNTKENIQKKKDICARFQIFYDSYPKKKARSAAEKAFLKLNPADDLLKIMLSKIELFKRTDDWQKEDGKYIPFPATWLNQKRWEDEIQEPVKQTPKVLRGLQKVWEEMKDGKEQVPLLDGKVGPGIQ